MSDTDKSGKGAKEDASEGGIDFNNSAEVAAQRAIRRQNTVDPQEGVVFDEDGMTP